MKFAIEYIRSYGVSSADFGHYEIGHTPQLGDERHPVERQLAGITHPKNIVLFEDFCKMLATFMKRPTIAEHHQNTLGLLA